MSLEQPISESSSPDLTAIASKLDTLEASISSTIRASQVRNTMTLIIAVVSVLLIGFWLAYAHVRFSSEVNPELVANLGQSYLEQYLPSATTQLESSLKERAPSVVAEGETRLRALPSQLDDQFRTNATKEFDSHMPEVQERLYQSLKGGLAQAQNQIKASPGEDDAARFRNLTDTLAQLYRTEAIKFADQVYSQYSGGANDIVNGLNLLAENKNLNPQQKTQRNLVRDFLILARSATPETTKNPAAAN